MARPGCGSSLGYRYEGRWRKGLCPLLAQSDMD